MNDIGEPRHRVADRAGDWEELASFMVYLERFRASAASGEHRISTDPVEVHRTDVHHLESGEHATWPGIAMDDACRWMATRAQARAAGAPPLGAADVDPAGSVHVIDRIHLVQGADAVPQALFGPEGVFAGYVEGHERFALEIQIRAAEGAAHDLDDSPWRLTIDALDQATWSVLRLGGVAGQGRDLQCPTHTCALVSRALSPGLYRLRIALRWTDRRAMDVIADIPLVQAV